MNSKQIILALSLGCVALPGCGRDSTAPEEPVATTPAVQPQLAATAGSWALTAPMPEARTSFKAATVKGVVYAIGGYGYLPARGQYDIVSRVEAYDASSNSWTRKASLPEPLFPNGATAINGKVYVAGGWNYGRSRNALYVYDPATNAWSRKTNLPFAIAASAGHQATIDGKLYVYAGLTVNADRSTGPQRFFRYDPSTNHWTTLSGPSHARRGGASAVIGGKFYLLGGTSRTAEDGGAAINDVNIYDPRSGWSTKQLGFHGLNRWGLAYAPVAGKLYIVGISPYSNGCYHNVATIYDPASNTTSQYSSPAPLRWYAAGVAAKDRFLVLGGSDYIPDQSGCATLPAEPTAEVRAYTP